MRPLTAIAVLLCCSLPMPGQSSPAVPLTSEMHHHLALKNEYVRVFQVEVAPHTSTLLHRHDHDYIWVGIGAAEVTNAVEGKEPVPLKVADGQTTFTPGPLTHLARNDAATPFRNVTVEILKPKKDDPAAQAEARGLDAGHGAAVETLFLHDGVRARDVILNPQAMLHMEEKAPPRLIIAVSAIRLRDHANGKRAVDQPAGGFAWVPAGPSMLVNLGDQPAHFVMLDFQ